MMKTFMKQRVLGVFLPLTPQSRVVADPRSLLPHNYAKSAGFDLGSTGGASLPDGQPRWTKEASLIGFYVAVVADLNMPKFITRRIIMSYKN